MNPFFSIVIPVYNVEKYLDQCVQSVLKQEFTDYEVILVDDGSTDSSGSMCDQFAEKHINIMVIHKVNGGASDARNTGIRAAKGEYVLFLDSDDYIAEGSLSCIARRIEKSKKPDVVFLEATKFFPDGSILPLNDGICFEAVDGKTHREVLQHVASRPKYPGSACTKATKRSVILDNNIFFEKGIISEDIDWTVNLLTKAESYSCEKSPFYFYRQGRIGSVTNTTTLEKNLDILHIIQKWASQDKSRVYYREINSCMAYEYCVLMINYAGLPTGDQKKIENEIKKEKWVLRYGQSRKVRAIWIATMLLGVKMTAKLVKRMYNL